VLGRLKVVRVYDAEELIMFLAQLLSMLLNKQLSFDVGLLFIDSLSSLFCGIPQKQHNYFQLVKDLVYYLKALSKRHNVGVVYTNSTREAAPTRVSEIKN